MVLSWSCTSLSLRSAVASSTQVALAPRHADAVEVLAQRHRVLARRAEQVADLGHGQPGAARQPLASPAGASRPRRRRAGKCRRRCAPGSPSATHTSNRSFRLAALPPAWPAKLAGSGGWKPRLLVRRDQLVLELAQVGAQLRLEVGPADAAQVADQLLLLRSADPPPRGPGRRRRRNRAATAPSAGRAWTSAGTARAAGPDASGCARPAPSTMSRVQQQLPAPSRRPPRPARRRSCSRSIRSGRLVGADVGAAHQVGQR